VRTVTKKGKFKLFGGEKVEVRIVSPSGKVVEGVKVVDLNNGLYNVNYKLPVVEVGNYEISVTINGEHISGSPFFQSVV